MKTDRLKFGKALRVRRAELGLSQQDVASRADVSANYLSLLENDHRQPSIEKLEKLADALHVPVAFLVSEAEPLREDLSGDAQALMKDLQDLNRRFMKLLDARRLSNERS